MIPRPDNRRPYNSRLDNLISWFAASVIVTVGVIYGLKLQEDRGKPKPERALARATPAQEPLSLQEVRAAERGRGRQARKPMQISGRGWTDIFVRTYWEIQSDRLLALAAGVVFIRWSPCFRRSRPEFLPTRCLPMPLPSASISRSLLTLSRPAYLT